MTTATAPNTLTPIEVARLSDEDGKLYEMVHGTLVEKPAMSTLSNWIGTRVAHKLSAAYESETAYVIQEQPTYCFTDPGHMRRPDVLLIWSRRLPEGLSERELHVAPDFVAEVVSPTNSWSDIRGRVEEYLMAGVSLVWVIEPGFRSVHAYRKDGSVSLYRASDTIRDEPLLPGFSVRVFEMFPQVTQPAGSGG